MDSRRGPNKPNKLTARDYRFIVICVALATVSLVIAVRYFYAAFPEASISFDISREESQALAERYLNQRGYQLEGYHHSVIFSYDGQAKAFLEKEMGLERAGALMGTKVKLWRWQHRWFRPLQKEEFRVDVTPRGDVVNYQHLIREEEPGATLTSQAAREVAEAFLTNVMKKNLRLLEFVQSQSKQYPLRTDHTFTWQDHDFSFQGSSYRFQVTVQGNQIGGYGEFLKLPEKWVRSHRALRSLNQTAGKVSTALTLLLFMGLLITLVMRIRHGNIRWKTALAFGITGAGLNFLAKLNSLPLEEFSYQTTESYGSFLIETVMENFLSALGLGALIFLLTAAAESLYRERYKDKVSLTHLFGWRGLRTKSFLLSLILGITLAPCFIAYQTIFYLLANKLGAWSPADVPYDDLLNTSLPWAFVVLSGFFPAVSEEFFFRLFSIPFLEKLLKNSTLPLILAGFIWGFGHSGYPNEPFYIRGIEVGLVGIVAGVIMVRFNILVLLVWHYTIDATYTALLLLRSDNLSFVLTGCVTAFIFLIPLLAALVIYLRTGSFESEAGLTNQFESAPAAAPEESPRIPSAATSMAYRPLSTNRILWGFFAVGLLLSLYLVKVERFGTFVDFQITRNQAKRLADDFLHDKHVDTSQFRSVTAAVSGFDALAAKYILLHENVKVLNDVVRRHLTSTVWAVRYFRPLEEEEYRVYVDPRRKSIDSFEHIVAEDAPGAELTKEQAVAIATQFLTSRGLAIEDLELIETTSEDLPARRDIRLIWQAREGDPRNIGDALFRLRVDLAGDKVSRFERFLKLPEDWVRRRRKQTSLTSLRSWASVFIWGVLGFFGITIFIRRARQGRVRWRQALWLASGVTGLYGLHLLNSLPLLYQDYNTSLNPNIHLITTVAGDGMALVFVFIAAAFVIGLGTSLYPEATAALGEPMRGRLARDAVISSLMLIGGMFGLARVRDILVARFPAAATVSGVAVPGGINTALPALSQLVLAILTTGTIVVALGLLAYSVRRYLKTPTLLAVVLVGILPLLVSDQTRTLDEFLLGMAVLTVNVGAALAFIRGILRNNLLAYPVGIFLLICAQDGHRLISQGAHFLRVNGAILFFVLAVVIGWLLVSHRKSRHRMPDRSGAAEVEVERNQQV